MVLGEYDGDQGFRLPNPVFIRREYPRLRFRIEWRMKTLRKNEDTWCKYYGIMMPNTIQPREHSKGSGMGDILHISVCKLNGNRHVAYLYENSGDRKLNLNYFDNDWNDNYRFAGVRNSLHFSPVFMGEFCFLS